MRVIRGCLRAAIGGSSSGDRFEKAIKDRKRTAASWRLATVMLIAVPGLASAAGFRSYDPLEKAIDAAERIEIREKTEKEKESGEGYVYTMKGSESEPVIEVGPEVIDPLKRLERIAFVKSPVGSPDDGRGMSHGSQSGQDHEKGKDLSGYAEMLSGYPMAGMAGSLKREPPAVAAFLIAIAKKESDWGNHVPLKDGQDCYNYWGFKGGPDRTESGYGCFDSPAQAVSVVGERIAELIGKNVDTPEKMVVWKCGSSCQGHDPASVRKWISDVGTYYAKANS